MLLIGMMKETLLNSLIFLKILSILQFLFSDYIKYVVLIILLHLAVSHHLNLSGKAFREREKILQHFFNTNMWVSSLEKSNKCFTETFPSCPEALANCSEILR